MAKPMVLKVGVRPITGARQKVGGTWRFKTLRTYFDGKILGETRGSLR